MTGTKTYYLRVEGVNLANFVYDTNNLSVIRGGSLILLELPKMVKKWLEDFKPNDEQVIKNAQAITLGASWGLYSFELCDPKEDRIPEKLASHIRDKFNSDYPPQEPSRKIKVKDKSGKEVIREVPKDVPLDPRHATVMVEVIEAGKKNAYQEDRERLTALVRWSQMCSPSIAFPSISHAPIPVENEGKSSSKRVCELDFVRPAARSSEYRINGKKRAVSASSYSRYLYGAWGKSDQWYEETTGLKDLPLFTHHFHELAEGYVGDEDPNPNLEGKMAVIYLDGNHFGKLQSKHCKTSSDQKDFDGTLREKYQAGALRNILEKIKNDPAWIVEVELNEKHFYPGCQTGDKIKKIRLETLLWGGDEIIWVAPAWRGWWLLGEFFRLVAGGLDGTPWNFKGNPLTFAAGMVFCHHTAPIYRIKDLAHGLAGIVKEASRDRNMATYQVLESFDLAGPNLATFRNERRPAGVREEEMLVNGEEMLEIAEYFQEVKDQIPKRALYRLVRCLYSDPEEAERRAKALREEMGDRARDCLDCLSACFGKGLGMWLHLLELWDYLVVPQGKEAGHV